MRDDAGRMQRLLKVEEGLRLLEADSEADRRWIRWAIENIQTFEVQPTPDDGGGVPDCTFDLCVTALNCNELAFTASTITYTFTPPEGDPVVDSSGDGDLCIEGHVNGEWTVELAASGHVTRTVTVTVADCANAAVTTILCPSSVTVTVRVGGCRPRCHSGSTTINIKNPAGEVRATDTIDWTADACLVGGEHCVAFPMDLSGDPAAAYDPESPYPCMSAENWTVEVIPPEGSGIATKVVPFPMLYCADFEVTANLEAAAGYVCLVDRAAVPEDIDYSDDQGSCTLSYQATGCTADSSNPATHAWVGGYTFTCDNADIGPCSGNPSLREIGSGTVGVSIIAVPGLSGGTVTWTVYKIYSTTTLAGCGSTISGTTVYLSGDRDEPGPDCRQCRVNGTGTQACSDLPSVSANGSYGTVYQHSFAFPNCTKDGVGASGDPPPCVAGNWSLSG